MASSNAVRCVEQQPVYSLEPLSERGWGVLRLPLSLRPVVPEGRRGVAGVVLERALLRRVAIGENLLAPSACASFELTTVKSTESSEEGSMGEMGVSEGRSWKELRIGVEVWGDRADEMRRGVGGKTGEGRDGGGVE